MKCAMSVLVGAVVLSATMGRVDAQSQPEFRHLQGGLNHAVFFLDEDRG